MIGNDGEEDRAKTRGLGWSDAGNKQQILAGFGTQPGHLDQDAVVENDEGGLLLVSRDFEALSLERGERVLGLRNLDLVQASPHAGLAPARQGHVATQRQRRLAREHGTSRLGDNPTITIFRVLRDQIRRVKLVKNAAPL